MGQQLTLESNSEQSNLWRSCMLGCGTVCQVLGNLEDGLWWPLGPGSHSHSSLGQDSLPPWLAHVPHSAGVGLAGQILAGSHLSTSDSAQTWPEDSESWPRGDISGERFMVELL